MRGFHKKHSEETKRKISLSKMGNIPWNKGMKGLWLSNHFNVLNSIQKREKHPRWKVDRNEVKSGDRFLHDPLQKQWRKDVKDRDKWTCRIADNNCAGKLEAHHILPWSKFPELRYQINNGITLCHAHHPRSRDEVAKLSPFFQSLVAEVN